MAFPILSGLRKLGRGSGQDVLKQCAREDLVHLHPDLRSSQDTLATVYVDESDSCSNPQHNPNYTVLDLQTANPELHGHRPS